MSGRRFGAVVRVAAVVAAVAALACGRAADAPAPAATERAGRVLTVGSISLTPSVEHEVAEPFARVLASRLEAAGVVSGRSVVADSVGAMAELLRSGEVDVYIDSPFPAALVARRSGAVPVLARRKQGVAEYHGVLFARRDSGIASPADLRGRMVAFGEPFSTASYLLPKASLAVAGERMERFDDPAAEVPADRIGYVLSGDAETSMVWVLKGKVDAGAINADYLDEMAGARMDEIAVILRTPPVPRNVVCLRPGLEPGLATAVERALLELTATAEGRRSLVAFRGTERFERMPGGAEGFYATLGPLLDALAEDLGGD